MNLRRFHIIMLFWFFCAMSLQAQEADGGRKYVTEAEAAYDIGKVEEAMSMLEGRVQSMSSSYRLRGYRLLSLCCLALDQPDEARRYATLVLKENPYYTPTVDYSPRFVDMIAEIRQGFTATITTASSQSESVNEAPSPVTIITAEMIEELGYNKSLNQILAAYVPGMVEVTSSIPGENLSMHNAYANGQELILIMENGHRLNNRFYNVGVTGYSISTEKIDHIEVLRGPASSLYGNVALSAVVNIITKSGRDVNGIKARYGNGTFGTHRADLTMGGQFMEFDVFAWASIYKSDGDLRHFNDDKGYYADFQEKTEYYPEEHITRKMASPDKIYVSSYQNMPAYDFGFSFKFKGFEAMLSRKSFTKLYELSSLDTGYDYDLYPTVNDMKPGNCVEETHIELGYAHPIGKVNLKGTAYADWHNTKQYEVYCDSSMTIGPKYDSETGDYAYDEDGNMIFETDKYYGSCAFSSYKEESFGGILNASTDYRLGGMKGSLLAGCQYEHAILDSRLYFVGSDFTRVEYGTYGFSHLDESGEEDNLSFYLQGKHYFTPHFIANVGFRYDLKYRPKENLTALSPRLALMYSLSEYLTLKLSYAESFSDLAIYYRYLFGDLFDMNPQRLSALQFTAMGKASPLHLHYEVSVFYNHYKNFMQWVERDVAYHGELNIINQGSLKNIGIEVTATYAYKRFSANLSLFHVHDISADYYYFNEAENKVNNVPHFTLNLHGAYKLVQNDKHELKVYAHPYYTSRRLNYTPYEATDFYVDGKWKLDLGMKYSFRHRLSFSVDCENLFNTTDYICGTSDRYMPQFLRGRNVMASVAYQF